VNRRGITTTLLIHVVVVVVVEVGTKDAIILKQ